MRRNIVILLIAIVAGFNWHCADNPNKDSVVSKANIVDVDEETPKDKPTNNQAVTISGQIANGETMRLFFEQFYFMSNTHDILGSATLESNGNFNLQLSKDLTPGLYRIRVGRKKIYIPVSGGVTDLKINGDLINLNANTLEVAGAGENYQRDLKLLTDLHNNSIGQDQAEQSIKATDNPGLKTYLAANLYGSNVKYFDQHLALKETLKSSDSKYAVEYAGFVRQMEAIANDPIQIGKPAPDIKLPSPDGKEYALSSLKGKVVLLDFWASWCGPCRRENPNVVRVYDKYNKEGFEVFSVSLDKPNGKDRWIGAIEKDNLKWPYHVSDLQFWNSKAAKQYKVSGIPRAFLIDRNGIIADMNLRGQALDDAVKKLLKQG